MQALGQGCVVMLLELIEGRIERTKRMAKDAMGRLAWCRRTGGADVVGALIVRDRQLTARGIVCRIRVRQSNRAHNQTDKQ